MPTIGREFWNKSRQKASGKDSRGELRTKALKQSSASNKGDLDSDPVKCQAVPSFIRHLSGSLRSESFDDRRVRHASAFTHCLQTKTAIGSFQLIKQGC